MGSAAIRDVPVDGAPPGASLGALIGVGTTFLLGENAAPVDASALSLVRDGDGMRAGVRIRLRL